MGRCWWPRFWLALLCFLESDLKRDAILQVDSTPEFTAGCTGQGSALIASHLDTDKAAATSADLRELTAWACPLRSCRQHSVC